MKTFTCQQIHVPIWMTATLTPSQLKNNILQLKSRSIWHYGSGLTIFPLRNETPSASNDTRGKSPQVAAARFIRAVESLVLVGGRSESAQWGQYSARWRGALVLLLVERFEEGTPKALVVLLSHFLIWFSFTFTFILHFIFYLTHVPKS